MKIGDLLYYRPNYDPHGLDAAIGLVVGTVTGFEGAVYFKTFWFDDSGFTEEPQPDSPHYSETVGVLSEGR
tara:strand:+ start:943 stop:1155 length:213 start_codon:yes stop_codon:yes gene_type:complete